MGLAGRGGRSGTLQSASELWPAIGGAGAPLDRCSAVGLRELACMIVVLPVTLRNEN